MEVYVQSLGPNPLPEPRVELEGAKRLIPADWQPLFPTAGFTHEPRGFTHEPPNPSGLWVDCFRASAHQLQHHCGAISNLTISFCCSTVAHGTQQTYYSNLWNHPWIFLSVSDKTDLHHNRQMAVSEFGTAVRGSIEINAIEYWRGTRLQRASAATCIL